MYYEIEGTGDPLIPISLLPSSSFASSDDRVLALDYFQDPPPFWHQCDMSAESSQLARG